MKRQELRKIISSKKLIILIIIRLMLDGVIPRRKERFSIAVEDTLVKLRLYKQIVL